MIIYGKRYTDYGSFIKLTFGERVQKISLDTGFSCPNRDGSKGYGGCTYCNNATFNPNYCNPQVTVKNQLEKGITFFSKNKKTNLFLAYFQAYTNTYSNFETIKLLYDEALKFPKIVGLVIGTRPDCISDEILDYLSHLSKKYFIALEMGVESTINRTLKTVNRCHTFEETQSAFYRASNRGIHLGAHLILGLPNESAAELLSHAKAVSKLPIDSLKIHHLQIVKNSVMAAQYKKNPENFNLFTSQDYINFIANFIAHLRPTIILERFINQAPPELLIAPKWHGIKNFEMVEKINKKMEEKNVWQGKFYNAVTYTI